MTIVPHKSKSHPFKIAIPARYTDTGKRRFEYFHTRADAESRIKAINLDGRQAVTGRKPEPVPPHFRSLAEMAFSELNGKPAEIIEAIELYKRTRLSVSACTVQEAIEQFQFFRVSRVHKSTHSSDSVRLLKLLYRFRSLQITSITELDLRHFFDGIPNALSVYKTVSVFFRWCKKYKKITINPLSDIEPPGQYGINNDVYTPDQFQKMLHACLETDKYKPLLPVLVLGGFCGLRPSEATHVTRNSDAVKITDIYPEYLEIRAGVAKKTKRGSVRRFLNDRRALEALRSWLPLFPEPRNGFLVPYAMSKIRKLKTDFQNDTGLHFLDNGLRNSFCSYLLSFDNVTIGQLAKLAGNSEAVLKRHYIEVLKPGDGENWFGIRPTK
jgi:integrase